MNSTVIGEVRRGEVALAQRLPAASEGMFPLAVSSSDHRANSSRPVGTVGKERSTLTNAVGPLPTSPQLCISHTTLEVTKLATPPFDGPSRYPNAWCSSPARLTRDPLRNPLAVGRSPSGRLLIFFFFCPTPVLPLTAHFASQRHLMEGRRVPLGRIRVRPWTLVASCQQRHSSLTACHAGVAGPWAVFLSHSIKA